MVAGQLLPSFTFLRKTGETDASGRQACDHLSRMTEELTKYLCHYISEYSREISGGRMEEGSDLL